MRIYYKQMGHHIHMRVFYNGKAGDLCCGIDEWDEFRACFSSKAQFIEDET